MIALEDIHQEFTDWCAWRNSAGRWADPVALAATRVRLSLQVCAQDPERVSSIRMLTADVADLERALAHHPSAYDL